MNVGPLETISKLDAARRQLREAILLFFERRDALAVHTLASASHQVLVDIARKKGLVSFIKLNPFLRDERKADWIAAINKAQNFLKHADRDANEQLEFRPELTTFFLLDSVQLHTAIVGTTLKIHNVFAAWFNLTYPDIVATGDMRDAIDAALKSGIDPNDFTSILRQIRDID